MRERDKSLLMENQNLKIYIIYRISFCYKTPCRCLHVAVVVVGGGGGGGGGDGSGVAVAVAMVVGWRRW